MVCGLCLFVIMWAWGFNVFACAVCEVLCDGVWCGVVWFVCSCVVMRVRVFFYAMKSRLFVVCVSACVCLYGCPIYCAVL